jgi:hypothetical protein
MTGIQPASEAFQSLRRMRRSADDVFNGAFAGFRLIGQQPGAVAAWGVMWFVAFSLSAVVLVLSRPMPAPHADYSTLAAKFGPFAVIIIAAFLLIWALNTVAVFRAFLQPDRGRFFYLRVGADEVRLAVMTLVAFTLILVFGGAPAFLLLTLATPFMQILPDQARIFTLVGATATICVDAWISVRLSLIAVETFAEGTLSSFSLLAFDARTFLVSFLCLLRVLSDCAGSLRTSWRGDRGRGHYGQPDRRPPWPGPFPARRPARPGRTLHRLGQRVLGRLHDAGVWLPGPLLSRDHGYPAAAHAGILSLRSDQRA